MATFLDLQANLKQLNIEKEAKSAISETVSILSESNIEHLKQGFDSEWKRFPKYKNAKYARAKAAINPLPGLGNPDLILTKSFSKSIKVSLQGAAINFEASDTKADDLIGRYGEDVLGVTDNQQEKYNQETFLPVFAQKIELQTGLKLM